MMVAGTLFDPFGTSINVGVRSQMSKIVGDADVGKAFGCLSAVQALTGIISPLIRQVSFHK